VHTPVMRSFGTRMRRVDVACPARAGRSGAATEPGEGLTHTASAASRPTVRRV